MQEPNSAPLTDLKDRQDIICLVDRFYERVRADDQLGPIFTTVARVDWTEHLPKLYNFWDTVLFRANNFRGNPIGAHAKLVPVADMSFPMFERWLTLFRSTVNSLFEGPNATHIIRCAEDMANVIYSKIHQIPDPRFDPARLSEAQRARYAAYRAPAIPSPEATTPHTSSS